MVTMHPWRVSNWCSSTRVGISEQSSNPKVPTSSLVDPGAAPEAPLHRVTGAGTGRVKMVLGYDGGAFHGFATNAGVATVSGTLGAALERVLRIPVVVTGAGRTDAGVHAWGQVVSFDAASGTDLVRLQRSLNGLCAPTIVVRSAEWCDDDFSARFSATSRRYRYTILNRALPSPFLAATTWHVPHALAFHQLELATLPFIGEHDFSAFCKRPKSDEPVSLVRRVLSATWSALDDDLVCFEIVGSAFCHNMVRSIVGTLVDVGLGKLLADDMLDIIGSLDRSRAGQVAPPHGLCLWEVGYDGTRLRLPLTPNSP